MRFATGCVLAVGLSLAGCSLQTLDFDTCTSSAACRAAFGYGSQCLTSGYCSDPFACSDRTDCESEFGMGSVCSLGGTCGPPASVACSDDLLCEATWGLGSTCVDGAACSRPSLTNCADNAACEETFGSGAVCGSDGVCRRSSSCQGDDTICVGLLGEGAFCDDQGTCRPGLSSCNGDDDLCEDRLGDPNAFCDTDGVCRIRVTLECATNADCVTNRGMDSTCDDGVCSAPATCSAPSDCVTAYGFGHRCEAGVCRLPVVTDCTSNDACRNTYGWGSTCGTAGLCQAAAPLLQCRITEPADFWNRPDAYRTNIVFGALMSFSNNAVEKNAIELAIRQINTQNVVGGRRFAVVFCDYGTATDTTTVNLATFLARDVGVSAILGGFTSSATQAAFQAVSNLDGADAVFISPSATSPALTEVDNVRPTDDDPGRIWTLVPTADAQTRILAARMKEDFPDTLSVRFLIEAFPGASEIEALLVTELEGLYGSSFQSTRTPFDRSNTSQIETAVDGALAGSPDAVVIITALATSLQRVLSRAGTVSGFDNVSIYVTDTGHDTLLLRSQSEIPNAILDGVTGVRPAPGRGGAFNRFASQYESQYGTPPTTAAYSAHAYDAAWLAALGATWSILQEGELSALGIARGLRRLSSESPDARRIDFSIETQYLTARNVFAEGGSVRVTGASGPIAFDPATELLEGGIIELWEIDTACTEGALDGRCFREITRTDL